MDTQWVSLSAYGVALIPIVVGLTSIAKMYIDSRWAPLMALALGIGGAFLIPGGTLQTIIMQGILIGISASGLFSGVKAVSGK